MIYGFDTSHHQEFSDYSALNKTKNAFVFLKASETKWSDPMFKKHCEGFAKTKLLRGAYHFLRFTAPNDGPGQANAFVDAVDRSGQKMELPPVLDIEDPKENLDPAQCVTFVKQWLDTVQARTGVQPIIYTGGWYWRDPGRMNNTNEFKGYTLWTSHYTNDPSKEERPNYGGWAAAPFWQYFDKGSVAGLSSKTPIIDLNVFQGEIDDLWKFVKLPNTFSTLSTDKMTAVQLTLTDKGFYNGAIDGSFNSSKVALNKWQSDNGYPAQDHFDPNHWAALFDLSPKPGAFNPVHSGVVISEQLNIRSSPDTGSATVALPLLKGQALSILEEKDGWYRVKPQVEGWVKKDFIRTS